MSKSQSEKPSRVVGLDVARGLLMAHVIIIIHGMFWLRLIPQPYSSALLFEMPLIFMVSGAAYYYGQIKAETFGSAARAYGSYLGSRAVRILAPYLVYALVAACIAMAMRHLDALQTLRYWLDPYWTGSGYSWLFLNAHLWFISPFLGVTALLPLVARAPAWAKAPLWFWAMAGALIVFAIDAAHMPALRLVQMIVFYGLWALFGFGLVAAPKRFASRDFVVLLILALAALAAAYILFPAQTNINMQRNKFPPNAIFFVFSCAWVCVFMLLTRSLDPKRIEALANFAPLKPFISAGYSVYLWQGLGYTAAYWAGHQLGLSVWIIWPIAIVLTVALGLLFSPVERLRLKRSAPTPRRA